MRRPFLVLLAALTIPAVAPAQGFTPEEAVKRMKLPDGFSVRCVASEPMIRQPLSISFDSRGRLWVLQYLQYPNPAGLKPVKQDQYLRTQWDKIPDPPPKGVKGLDKITICYDPDENGVFRQSKDFASGLNLASGFCLGNGGVYVVQPPYLLFYPDKNEDDVPDGDPEVLLSGLGLDDTHSLANSLQWGPDGWLYGAAGSTSTCRIKDPSGKAKEPIEFQQGIWRYHPKTKQFELFSEGGGNTYGLDFDRHGNVISGTNWGGFAMLHQMQGAYYVKGFSKHGPLHNPHAYGYFDHVPYKNFKGGHVTCGGILYDADVYPKEFRHQYIAGNLLSNAVYWHKMTPKGASFTAEHGGELLEANDTWFRPVDLQLGPDGCVYVADWYDKRAAHLDPIDNWDKTNGRVYKIEYTGAKRLEPFDLRKKSNAELVELLKHPNVWWRREARRLLAERPADKATLATLTRWVNEDGGQLALEALWALPQVQDVRIEADWLKHPNPAVRAWTIRREIERRPDAGVREVHWRVRVDEENSLPVLSEYAIAMASVTDKNCLHQILDGLLNHPAVRDDPHLPNLIWWSIERTASRNPALVATLVCRHEKADPFRDELLRKLTCRLCCSEQSQDVLHGMILASFRHGPLIRGILDGLRRPDCVSLDPVVKQFALGNQGNADLDQWTVYELHARLNDTGVHRRLEEIATDPSAKEADRVRSVQILTGVGGLSVREFLTEQLPKATGDALRKEILIGLAKEEGKDVPPAVLAGYPNWSPAVKAQAIRTLLARPEWAAELFRTYADGKFPKADLTVDHARAAVALNDPELTKLVEKQFGKLASTAGEKRARIDALNAMFGREKPGDPTKGKAVFDKSCAACHQLFGEGGKVGPDLTSADRKNRYALLTNIVDPSGYIRPEFVTHVVNTLDGRTFSGVVTEQTAEKITVASYVNNKVETTAVARKDIDRLDASAVSLMPEKLLDTMSEAEIRDLVAYVMQDAPKAHGRPSVGLEKKLRVALISGSLEYKSDDTLPVLQKLLEEKYPVECVRMFCKTDTDIPGLDKLAECDVAIFFTRRLKIDGEQLKAVKVYCESGKPVIGIRTASHGFQNWLEMDKEVFGGNYKNHYGAGPKCETRITDAGKDHPILKGVKPFTSEASLYKNPDLPKDVTVLLTGTAGANTEPIAWVRERTVRGKTQRVFYTSLGHPKDFEEESFTRMLRNAIGWATGDERLAR